MAHPMALASLLLLVMLTIYSVLKAVDNWQWKVAVICIGILSWLFFKARFKHRIIWMVFIALLLIDLFFDYFTVANHHFMFVLVVGAVLSYNYHLRNDLLFINIQLLLVVVLAASVLQKLMSPQFISGEFYYFMMNRGFLFKNYMDVVPQSAEIIKSNGDLFSALKKSDPNLGLTMTFRDVVPNLGLISQVFAWTTIAMELLVASALLLKPKHTGTHLLLMVMIIGILCTRIETGFMALLAICGLILSEKGFLKGIYVIIITGCILLIATRIGMH